MKRRTVVAASASAAAGLFAQQGTPPLGPQYIFVRKVYMRNSADNQVARMSEYMEKTAMPAMQRAGANGIGMFTSMLAPDAPFHMVIAGFPSLAAMEIAFGKMAGDAEFLKAHKAFDAIGGQRYVRFETSVLRGFAKFPGIVTPKPIQGGHVFELRTYESHTTTTLAEKIKMFNEGEIEIFQKTGLEPVFFGETVFGDKQPNLTYMLYYPDLAARDANWKKFVSHPDWLKLRATPGWSDAEIVSNISSSFLRGLPFSPIR